MSKLTDNYAAIAAATGFRYDAECNALYGQRDGFDIVLYAADSRYPYLFTLHTAAKNTNGTMLTRERSKELAKSVGLITLCKQDGSSISVTLKQAKPDKLQQQLGEVLSAVTAFLRRNGFIPCCNLCGQETEVAAFRSGGTIMHLCPECEVKMQGQLSIDAQKQEQKKENIVGGIVGAFLGSLLGVLCIIVLSRLGYVAALSGAIMAVGVLKGYEMLGGKLTKKGIVISCVIMLVMTYIGDKLDWAIVLLTEGGGADAGFNLFECYRLIPLMISEGVIEMTSFVADLVLIYLFLLLGAVPAILSKVREKSQAGVMVKIGSAANYGVNIQ